MNLVEEQMQVRELTRTLWPLFATFVEATDSFERMSTWL